MKLCFLSVIFIFIFCGWRVRHMRIIFCCLLQRNLFKSQKKFDNTWKTSIGLGDHLFFQLFHLPIRCKYCERNVVRLRVFPRETWSLMSRSIVDIGHKRLPGNPPIVSHEDDDRWHHCWARLTIFSLSSPSSTLMMGLSPSKSWERVKTFSSRVKCRTDNIPPEVLTNWKPDKELLGYCSKALMTNDESCKWFSSNVIDITALAMSGNIS